MNLVNRRGDGTFAGLLEIVSGILDRDELNRQARFAASLGHADRLVEGDQVILLAMREEKRWIAAGDIKEGARLAIELPLLFFCTAKQLYNDLAGVVLKFELAHGEIRDAVVGRGGHNPAGNSRPAAVAFKSGVFVGGCDQLREVTARRGAGYADPGWINSKSLGVGTKEADGAFTVLDVGGKG